jgi:pimeloyl-ACP methyl ester carboxylesterase
MTTFTTHDAVELDYQDSGGDGFPLLMLHGWGQTKAMLRNQLADLAPNHRVIALDLRGHGLSSKPHYGYRIARFSRDVWELLDHLNLDRVDALGWSMGVSIWWSFIDQYGTDRIRRFVAVDQPSAVAAVPWMSAEEQAASGAIFDVAALVTLGESLHGPDGVTARDGFVRGMFTGDKTDPDLLAFVMAELDTVPPRVAVPLLFDHCAQDWRDVLPRIDVETLVVGCEGSHVDPSSQRYIADQIPRAQLHVFPSDVASSHFPFLETPPSSTA